MLTQRERIYLDQAATSWPKHPQVLEAVMHFLQHQGAAAGRGSYASSLSSLNWIDRARLAIARLINAPADNDIALMQSGTHALNEALHGVLQPGSHVITTAVEHNSVLRPLEHMRQQGIISLDIVGCDSTGWIDPQDLFRARRSDTTLLAMSHASNVTGTIQDIESVGAWCRANEIVFLVDAAQTIGYWPIDVERSGIDYLAAPGHKGLGGILGTGFLYLKNSRQDLHQPLMFGGTGSQSESLLPHLPWPQKVEAGNHNLPGIVSMAKGAEILLAGNAQLRVSQIEQGVRQLKDLLARFPTLLAFGPAEAGKQVSVVSWRHPTWAPTEVAAVLDAEFGIEVRAGLHCAALIHAYLGSESGGTVRISFGHALTEDFLGKLSGALEAVAGC
jgi:cysteine desulfurase / selenocysteine lyase